MLEVFGKIRKFIFFLVIITSISADKKIQQKSRVPKPWEPLLMKLNEAIASDEKLYKYIFMKKLYGNDLSVKNVLAYYYQQTNCSKSAAGNLSNCVPDPKGKIALCESNTNTVDELSACKFTGDKVMIPMNDGRSLECALRAVEQWNRINSIGGKSLSSAVVVTTDVGREIAVGQVKCIFQFSTEEVICQKVPGPENTTSLTCGVNSPRYDCEGGVVESIHNGSMVGYKFGGVVKCKENKDPKAIAAMKSDDKIFAFTRTGVSSPESTSTWTWSFNTVGERFALSAVSSDFGFKVEQALNKQPGQEFLFKYVWRQTFYGDNVEREMFHVVYLQESECKAAEQQNEPIADATKKNAGTQKTTPAATESCKLKPNGKVAVCKVKDSFEDVSGCKFTGDKFELPKEDRRSFDLAAIFINYENKRSNKTGISDGLNDWKIFIASPIQSEVTNTGTKYVLRFSTELVTILKKDADVVKHGNTSLTMNSLKKERVDCEGPVEVLMPAENETKCGFKADVKCVPSKERLPSHPHHEDLETLIVYRLKSKHSTRSERLSGGAENVDGEQVTTMSTDGSGTALSETNYDRLKVKAMAEEQQKELNDKVAKEFLYKFVVDTMLSYAYSGTDYVNKSINYLENLFQETTCKKADEKIVETCEFNPKGKIALCKYPGVSACKFSGDKFELDKNDEYVRGLAFDGADAFSKKNYPQDGKVFISGHNLESSVQYEILNDGLKSSFKFNASEERCPTPKENETVECETVKRDIHCEAILTTLVDHTAKRKLKFENDVKCPDLQPADKKSAEDMNEKKRSPSKPKRSKKRRGSAKQQKLKP